MKLHIPKPCHEDWEQMLPEEQGRHCQMCSKTVVDFTNWEPEAIRDYMIQRSGERVCGRFTIQQLDAPLQPEDLNWPALISVSGLSFLKKVAAVIIVAFGLTASSCDNKVQVLGISRPLPDTAIRKKTNTLDSVASGQKTVLPGATDGEKAKCKSDKQRRRVSVAHSVPDSVSIVQGELVGVIIGDVIPSDSVIVNKKE